MKFYPLVIMIFITFSCHSFEGTQKTKADNIQFTGWWERYFPNDNPLPSTRLSYIEFQEDGNFRYQTVSELKGEIYTTTFNVNSWKIDSINPLMIYIDPNRSGETFKLEIIDHSKENLKLISYLENKVDTVYFKITK